MKDIFGNDFSSDKSVKPKIEVSIYCDEVKNIIDPDTKEIWHYIGMIVIPTHKKEIVLDNLDKARFFKEFDPANDLSKIDRRYFRRNNRIVHFSEMDADTFYIAKRWHSYLKHECSKDEFYFNILGICKSRLNEELFPKRDFMTIYNRFFRTAIAYSLQKFFSREYEEITIEEIIHEEGEQKDHQFFAWHSIYRIEKNEEWPISCRRKKIDFINKNHRENREANFLQFIDLLLGVTRNAIHFTNRGKFQTKITEEYLPLIEKLITNPDNPNSKTYPAYHRRMNISFFPKRSLDPKDNYFEIDRKRMFYRNTDLRFKHRKQRRLL